MQKTQLEVFFEKIIEDNTEKVYWLVRKMVIDHELANDITQDVFLKVWKNLSKFNQQAKVSTWVHKIAVNTTLDYLRKKKESRILDTDENSFLLNSLKQDVWVDGEEIELKLQASILELPDKQRLVFNMKYFENRSFKEIAELTDTSVGALKASYHYAVKKLKILVVT